MTNHQKRITKKPNKEIKPEFVFKFNYNQKQRERDLTSDLWIDFGRTKGLTYGEMSPIEICESQIKHCLKGMEIELETTFRNEPDYLLSALVGQYNMLKNWQYILHCVLYYEKNGRSDYERR